MWGSSNTCRHKKWKKIKQSSFNHSRQGVNHTLSVCDGVQAESVGAPMRMLETANHQDAAMLFSDVNTDDDSICHFNSSISLPFFLWGLRCSDLFVTLLSCYLFTLLLRVTLASCHRIILSLYRHHLAFMGKQDDKVTYMLWQVLWHGAWETSS